MYEKIGYSGALIFLGCLSAYDIKWKKIPAAAVGISGILSMIYFAVGNHSDLYSAAFCMLPGMALLLLSLLTGEKIGYGDGAAVLVLGFWTGGLFCMEVVLIGIMLSGVYSVYCIIRRNTGLIPFVPFLFAALEVMFVYE